MAKHYKNLFQSLYIYNFFKGYAIKKKQYSLSKEIYSMETRSLAIASTEYKNATYIIKHNKFEALPYDMYSLNMISNPIYIENLLTAKLKKSFNKKQKLSYRSIVIQASDSCGSSISSYEFYSYVDILNVLEKLISKAKLFLNSILQISIFLLISRNIFAYIF